MDRIHYAGHSVLTGTAIAEALLDYAQALAEAGGSSTVQLPILNEDGSRGRSEVLVGPSSQLISDAEESEHEELTDVVLVSRLRTEAERLRAHGKPSTPLEIPASPGATGWSADFDL
ncbi:MAG: hypothetical protein ABWY37_06930 [Microbacterium pygmaeum]